MEFNTKILTKEGIKCLGELSDTFFEVYDYEKKQYALARVEQKEVKSVKKLTFDDNSVVVCDEKQVFNVIEKKEGKEAVVEKPLADLKRGTIVTKSKTNFLDTPISNDFDYNDGFVTGMLYWTHVNKCITLNDKKQNVYNFAFKKDKPYTVGFVKHLSKHISGITDTNISLFEKDEHVFLSIDCDKMRDYFDEKIGVSTIDLPRCIYESSEMFRKGFIFAFVIIRRMTKKIKIGEEEKDRVIFNLSDKTDELIKETFEFLGWYGIDYIYDDDNKVVIVNPNGLDSLLKNTSEKSHGIGGRIVSSIEKYEGDTTTFYKVVSVSYSVLLIKYNYHIGISGS